jgi:hypothetical protein
MISGLTFSKPMDCAGSVPRPVGARTARRVMTAPAAVTGNVVNAAVPDVDCARVCFSHIGERPHSKHLLVRTSDGVSLAVCDTGPRTAEHTVVLLHGLCLNQTSWEPQITYLLRRYGRSVRVISQGFVRHRFCGECGRLGRREAAVGEVRVVAVDFGALPPEINSGGKEKTEKGDTDVYSNLPA